MAVTSAAAYARRNSVSLTARWMMLSDQGREYLGVGLGPSIVLAVRENQ